MNKRTRAGPLPASIFAGVVRSVQEKNQLFLAFIPRMTILVQLVHHAVNELVNTYEDDKKGHDGEKGISN